MPVGVAAFYRFFDFPDHATWQAPLLEAMRRHDVRGSILLASEGVNGTIAGPDEGLGAVHRLLETIPGCAPLARKLSRHDTMPFGRAKVRLKKELISLGEEAVPLRRTGRPVAPAEWNRLIADPEVMVVDAHNGYETHVGAFRGAWLPATRKFTQLPDATRERLDPATHRKIATYCTGGIRCEKYTAWLLDQGYDEVYQLDGGILAYLEAIPEQDRLFEGACYVFDERVAVDGNLNPDAAVTACRACGHALKPEDRAMNGFSDEHCPFCDSHPPSNA